MSIKSLVNQIQAYNPDAEVELLERCYRFAQEAHEGQQRKSGEPYFTHCLKTCLLYTSPSPRDGLLSRMPSSA